MAATSADDPDGIGVARFLASTWNEHIISTVYSFTSFLELETNPDLYW